MYKLPTGCDVTADVITDDQLLRFSTHLLIVMTSFLLLNASSRIYADFITADSRFLFASIQQLISSTSEHYQEMKIVKRDFRRPKRRNLAEKRLRSRAKLVSLARWTVSEGVALMFGGIWIKCEEKSDMKRDLDSDVKRSLFRSQQKPIQKSTKACKTLTIRDTRTTLSVLYRTPFNGKKLLGNNGVGSGSCLPRCSGKQNCPGDDQYNKNNTIRTIHRMFFVDYLAGNSCLAPTGITRTPALHVGRSKSGEAATCTGDGGGEALEEKVGGAFRARVRVV
ncbi:cyclic nucleotide-gated ion channel 1 [Dorcoceras hygrometricum]|uniref:Cyclic nucleotide-gated ion channel 1 n=1 Tax=Dorcoceras hygrometricum TaxID=472368 RepID=A0A2Z7CAA4_9LAMI|nr:cyclic nucleotide-gated ion channel 1 [Dorcoceras hygrometricum]